MAKKIDFNDNDYQEHYRITYSAAGHTYMHVRPAYRFGFEAATAAQTQGHDWDDSMERALKRAWESRGAALRWEDARHAIREGWHRARGLTKPRALGSSTVQMDFLDIEG